MSFDASAYHFDFQHEAPHGFFGNRLTWCYAYDKGELDAWLAKVRATARGSDERLKLMCSRPLFKASGVSSCNLATDNFSKRIGRDKSRGRCIQNLIKAQRAANVPC